MRKIVLPLVETERSLLALQYVKKHFAQDQAEIVIVMADESLGISATREEEAEALALVEKKLELVKNVLDGYQVVTKAYVGKAGPCIVKAAREYNADYIVMTKSAQPDMLSMVGRTTDYVLNNAYTNVLIISENRVNAGEYKGLIYKKAQATVNLRGQIGDKQSECLLPSVDADCNYHFEVTVGKIRFFHTTYNPETSNWDLPPRGDQLASVDVAAGEAVDILVKANSIEGKADRIRIINRGMKQEAVFNYKITAATAPKPLNIPEAPGAMPAPAVISLEEAVREADQSIAETEQSVAEPEQNIAEAVLEEMPVPSMFGAEFEPIIEEETFEPVIEEAELEPIFESGELDLDALEEMVDETVNDAVDETTDELEDETAEIELEEDAVESSDDTDFAGKTLVGLEEYLPDDEEINDLMDELTDAIGSFEVNPAMPVVEKEERPSAFTPMSAVMFGEHTEDAPIEPAPAPVYYEPATGAVDPAFDEIFEAMPNPDPIEEVPRLTLEESFDEIINEFKTGQMNYVEEGPIELDDFI